ncbi:MAG: S10 family peptidase [Flavobacteriaceae bacterium]
MHTIYTIALLFTAAVAYAQSRTLPVDTLIVTNHKTTIKGQQITYRAETGTQPVWNDEGQPMASLFYTYYKRTDVKNAHKRPLIFSFNGGPGSASVWMHVAYTGPRILKIDDEGYPVQPYGFEANPYSILDVADIVYINPVNTGYSRMIEVDGKMPDRDKFFGINADIAYLAEWLNTFTSRKQRWESPKYLIGESYGGTRVMGLSLALQNHQWMYLNGVILVSPADYKTLRVGGPVASSLNLPYYTAAAWYHQQLPPALQQKDLLEILPEAEDFAINSLIPAIAKGGFLPQSEKQKIADQMAFYSGIDAKVILQHNLDLPTGYFWKELLRHQGKNIGRLDSRYLGIDKKETGDYPDYSAELTSWLHSFTPAINHYLRKELKFKTDIKYNMFGPVHPWNEDNDNTRDDLRQAMAQNPYLRVLTQSGYYDGATTYFAAKYSQWQMDPSGKMRDRFSFKGYRSGHMMYLRREDLRQSNEDIRTFIRDSNPNGKAAKY